MLLFSLLENVLHLELVNFVWHRWKFYSIITVGGLRTLFHSCLLPNIKQQQENENTLNELSPFST